MRKEIVWVAVIGIVLGLIFAFGIYRINSRLPKKVEQVQTPNPKPETTEFKIVLDKPEGGDVITQDSVKVTGITKSSAFVVFSGEKSDYITKAAADGTFSQDIDLTSGVNQIKLFALDAQGKQSSTKVLIVYSSVFEPKTFETSSSQTASGENDIRDKVAQKVAEALNKPKAFLGTVTDIADSTIQIKSIDSQIEQISIRGDNIDVVNTTGKANKAVKLSDIAIGDFIVAMGYVDTNSVLSAQRILISDAVSEPTIKTFIAKVTDTTTKGLSVSLIPDGSTAEVNPSKNTDVYDFAEGKTTSLKLSAFSEEDIVIYVLDASETTSPVRSIFRVQTSQ